MSTFLTALCVGQTVLPISREPIPLTPLVSQFEASGIDGELRVLDEATGRIVVRYRLNEKMEEGDIHQPYPD